MVLVASEQKLLMMRPYQIYAVKNIVECIEKSLGNGYVWHTTGSGKTLTSFKASTLLKANPTVDKCLFVVDRKDLDRQTREEFNRFGIAGSMYFSVLAHVWAARSSSRRAELIFDSILGLDTCCDRFLRPTTHELF